MSPLPAEFRGLWKRAELVVDGGEVQGTGRSYWFQAAEQFLDFRAASQGIQSEAFYGTTRWNDDEQTLTWDHEIDLHEKTVLDVGRVDWEGEDLIEYGTASVMGETIEYKEVWRRSAFDAQVVIANRTDGEGRMAFHGNEGAVVIDNRPTGVLHAGHFVHKSWAWVFDLVMGIPLATADGDFPQPGETFEAFDCSWTTGPVPV